MQRQQQQHARQEQSEQENRSVRQNDDVGRRVCGLVRLQLPTLQPYVSEGEGDGKGEGKGKS